MPGSLGELVEALRSGGEARRKPRSNLRNTGRKLRARVSCLGLHLPTVFFLSPMADLGPAGCNNQGSLAGWFALHTVKRLHRHKAFSIKDCKCFPPAQTHNVTTSDTLLNLCPRGALPPGKNRVGALRPVPTPQGIQLDICTCPLYRALATASASGAVAAQTRGLSLSCLA